MHAAVKNCAESSTPLVMECALVTVNCASAPGNLFRRLTLGVHLLRAHRRSRIDRISYVRLNCSDLPSSRPPDASWSGRARSGCQARALPKAQPECWFGLSVQTHSRLAVHGRRMRIGPPFGSASTSALPRVTFTRPCAASSAATRRMSGIRARQASSSADITRATSDGQIDAEGARAANSVRIVSAMA